MKINTNSKILSSPDYNLYAQMFQKNSNSGTINGSFTFTPNQDGSFYANRCTFYITYNDNTTQNFSPDYNLYSDVSIVIYNQNNGTLEFYTNDKTLKLQISNIKELGVRAESTTSNKWLCMEVLNV